MNELWKLYRSDKWEEPFLILSIYLFITASIIFYLLLITSRHKKIIQEKRRLKYSKLIENLMFSVVFEDVSAASIIENQEYKKLSKFIFFREVVMEAVINLHKNYEGVYAKKLEQFYKESGLIKDSFVKLRSRKWEVACVAISELAEMNINRAYKSIVTISKSKNKTLKINAISACVKLAGARGILHLADHIYPIDNWTQINIIHAFKKNNLVDTLGIELLLESQNSTVVSLGLKLIKELKLGQKITFVEQLVAKDSGTNIKYEAQNVVQSLMQQN